MRRQIEFNVLATIATNFFDFMHLEIVEKNCRSWPCYLFLDVSEAKPKPISVHRYWRFSEREANKISRWKQFHFEMFAFLSQFLDVNPSIYLIICCSTLLLWLYLMHDEFFNSDAHQTSRLDVYLVHEKKQTRKIPNNFNHQEIPWIQGNARFRLPFPHAFHANNISIFAHSVDRMQQIFHKYWNKFCGKVLHRDAVDVEWIYEPANANAVPKYRLRW